VPTYINNYTKPVYYGDTVFIPNQAVQTLNVLDNRAFIIGTKEETFAITGTNNSLVLRFNDEDAWTTVSLTTGAAQHATDIANDINTAYGSTVASAEGGRIRIDAPISSNVFSAIYIAATGTSAHTVLGLTTNDVNPVAAKFLNAFIISDNASPYTITTADNTFIFKCNNNPGWITVSLTTGVAVTAETVAADINAAYEEATADATKVAFAVTPITGGDTYVKLVAPLYNSTESKLYIKSTGNTALTPLGFLGDDFEPVVKSSYPTLIETSDLPLYNPILAETTYTFAGAGSQHHYLVDPGNCSEVEFFRVTSSSSTKFTCYIESISNLPPFTLVLNESFSLNLKGYRVTKVIIVAAAAGNITIRELMR